ncbi:hypothetical protein BT63DRAFT_454235 [Microthyrium microscopicum]|uniref:Gfd2/YDR514C-like C-terminal domain-containing protein n=1 Tax=Microthyrium microscopicum TaxID=703497 RepID=A0A6A6UGP7_9PEZI|nr:hypothetical protein BT63DRAFT_454235 [Microthyrium microscopicum]
MRLTNHRTNHHPPGFRTSPIKKLWEAAITDVVALINDMLDTTLVSFKIEFQGMTSDIREFGIAILPPTNEGLRFRPGRHEVYQDNNIEAFTYKLHDTATIQDPRNYQREHFLHGSVTVTNSHQETGQAIEKVLAPFQERGQKTILVGYNLSREFKWLSKHCPDLAKKFDAWLDIFELVHPDKQIKPPSYRNVLRGMGILDNSHLFNHRNAANDAVRNLAILAGFMQGRQVQPEKFKGSKPKSQHKQEERAALSASKAALHSEACKKTSLAWKDPTDKRVPCKQMVFSYDKEGQFVEADADCYPPSPVLTSLRAREVCHDDVRLLLGMHWFLLDEKSPDERLPNEGEPLYMMPLLTAEDRHQKASRKVVRKVLDLKSGSHSKYGVLPAETHRVPMSPKKHTLTPPRSSSPEKKQAPYESPPLSDASVKGIEMLNSSSPTSLTSTSGSKSSNTSCSSDEALPAFSKSITSQRAMLKKKKQMEQLEE